MSEGAYSVSLASGAAAAPSCVPCVNNGKQVASARLSNTSGSTSKEPAKIQGKDEQSRSNNKPLGGDLLDNIDPLDHGATQEPDAGKWLEEDDNGQDTGPTPEMRFPYLDIEPNSITSLNTDQWEINLVKRVKKPTIDYHSLAYEAIVGNLSGHKRAYNSKSYGSLDPTIEIDFGAKALNRKVWHLDSESLQDSLAEAPFGFRKTNEALANDYKRNMRTFVLPNSHYHGGPTMYKRGLNQYRNKALRRKAEDPNPDSVEVAVQNARDAFVLNDTVLYSNNNTKLQFKTPYNAARTAPQSENSGSIRAPTNWFGVQEGRTGSERSFGYGTSSTGMVSERSFSHAPSQKNTGPYATHISSSNVPAPTGIGV